MYLDTFDAFLYSSTWVNILSTSVCLFPPGYVSATRDVCVSGLSPEVYLGYLWGRVTMANPVFRWLFSTLRGELAEPEVSSCYRTPWPGVTSDTVTTHTHAHTETCTHVLAECLHMHARTGQSFHTQTLSLEHIERVYLSLLAQPPSLSSLALFIYLLYYFSASLSLSSLIPRSVRLLFTLGFPDMISMKTCSSGHALPVLYRHPHCLSCSHTGTLSGLQWIEWSPIMCGSA